MKQILYKSRKWLANDTTAFIYSNLERENHYLWGAFKLADCSRIVSFDINVETAKERKVTVKKLMLISREAYDMAKAIEKLGE